MIWEQYQPAISLAGRTKFQNFSPENIQAFYRLKLQSIEERLTACTGGMPQLKIMDQQQP
jgi:hypothetical protein